MPQLYPQDQNNITFTRMIHYKEAAGQGLPTPFLPHTRTGEYEQCQAIGLPAPESAILSRQKEVTKPDS